MRQKQVLTGMHAKNRGARSLFGGGDGGSAVGAACLAVVAVLGMDQALAHLARRVLAVVARHDEVLRFGRVGGDAVAVEAVHGIGVPHHGPARHLDAALVVGGVGFRARVLNVFAIAASAAWNGQFVFE